MARSEEQPPQERTAPDPDGDASDDGRRSSAGRGHRRSDRPVTSASGTASFRRCGNADAAVARARRGQVHERFVRPRLCQDRQQQACCQPVRKTLHGASLGEELGGKEDAKQSAAAVAHGSQLTAPSCRGVTRTRDLRVMSPASYHCSTRRIVPAGAVISGCLSRVLPLAPPFLCHVRVPQDDESRHSWVLASRAAHVCRGLRGPRSSRLPEDPAPESRSSPRASWS